LVFQYHFLNDENASAIIQSLSYLLDSPEERVQYHCLRALRWLLWASKDDKKKNEKDQVGLNLQQNRFLQSGYEHNNLMI